jgi:hypothetical protein
LKKEFFYVNSVVYLGNPYGNYFIDIIEYKTVYSIRDTAENNAIRKILTTLPSSQNSDGGCCCILLYEVTDNATWYLLYFVVAKVRDPYRRVFSPVCMLSSSNFQTATAQLYNTMWNYRAFLMTRPGGYSASRFDVLCYSAYLIFKLFE